MLMQFLPSSSLLLLLFLFLGGGGGGQISCIMGDVQVAYCFSFAFAADNCGSIQSHLWRNVADSFCPTLPTLPFPKGGLSM